LNFLSHFYFERYATSPERIVGALLPDLLKNSDKSFMLKPQHNLSILQGNPALNEILKGWEGHLEVDRLFHNSDFFFKHTHQLKQQIQHTVADLPIRPSFLAHIALELLLDHILLKDQAVSVDKFYAVLNQVNRGAIHQFLKVNQLPDIPKFELFYTNFLQWEYLYEYVEVGKITHALFSICKRIWSFELQQVHLEGLSEQLKHYLDENLDDYKDIYQYIQFALTDRA